MVSLSLVYFGSYYARYRISRQSALLAHELNEVAPAAQSFDTIASDAAQLAASAKEVVDLNNKEHVWPIFFAYIENSLPTNVYLDSLATSQEKDGYTVIISGAAQDRKAVGAFREKLLQYTADGESTERVSQVIIDSITASSDSAEQSFTLRATMSLEPAS